MLEESFSANTTQTTRLQQATVVMYSKPSCPYCMAAKVLLERKQVAYEDINIEGNPEKKQEMVSRSEGRTTVPQIFINNKPIGGFDDLLMLEKKQALDSLLFSK